MLTISQIVNRYIQTTPYIEEALEKRLINLSSLARYIKPYIESELFKKIKLGAIIMALKRQNINMSKDRSNLSQTLRQLGDITVRSNLIEYTFTNSDTLVYKHAKLLKKIEKSKNTFLTITHGIFETTLFGSSIIENDIRNIFKEEDLVSILKNLSSITIKLPENTVKTPGVHYAILKQLAWQNINVIDSVSTYTEFTIVLDSKQTDIAFSVLNKSLEKSQVI